MINKSFNELNNSDWGIITKEINNLFVTEILNNREKRIVVFFINVLNNKNEYQLLKNGNSPNKIDIIYSPSSAVLGWLRARASYNLYNFEKIKNEPELRLNHYSFYIGDELSQRVFDNLKVDYSEEFGDDVDDSGAFWTDQFDLEVNFVKKCWKKALINVNSSIIGIFVSGDSSNPEIILNN